jgi:hypothetical protein
MGTGVVDGMHLSFNPEYSDGSGTHFDGHSTLFGDGRRKLKRQFLHEFLAPSLMMY